MCKDKKFVLALIMLIPLLLSARLYVDDDYTAATPGWGVTTFDEIQDAIDNASNEETIYVYPGTYEHLTIGNIGLTIEHCGTGDVIVDGDDSEECIYFTSNCNTTTTLRGLTLINGYGGSGAGIHVSCDRTIKIEECEIRDCTSVSSGAGINSWCADLIITDTSIYNNTTGIANEINGGGIRFMDGDLTLENVIFANNTSKYGGAIYLKSTDEETTVTAENVLIYENTATEDGGAMGMNQEYPADDLIINMDKVTIADNNSTNGVGGIYEAAGTEDIDLTIINSIIWDNDSTPQIPADYDVTYSCVDGNTVYPGDENINDDPEFVNAAGDDYTLDYLSPCIDAGNRSSTYDDDDGSMADMGYAYHEQYKYEWPLFGTPPFQMRSNWNWICFDQLPVNEGSSNIGQSVSTALVRWHWNDIPDSCGWFNETCGTNPWFYGLDEDSDEFFDTWSGTGNLSSLKGYKIYNLEDSDAALFTRGDDVDDEEDVSTAAGADTWVGYFPDDTQSAEDALPSAVLNDCVKIQTQRWATSRATTGDPWSSDPDDLYLNYTDMVVLKTTSAQSFPWQSSRDDTEPIIRPYAVHFEWEEEIDYLPIFVEFDPADVPDEVAVYVGGGCQGAEVVEGLNCQICAYILEEDQGQEIEFEFWYDGRGENERKDSYQIHENGYPVVSNTLFTGQPGEFYTLSFNKGETIEPVPYNFCCYPNPFNPETTVSFSLEELSEVQIMIYNVKGQKVRTLADETFRPDDYSIVWKGKDDNGHRVGSGMYFVRLKINDELFTNKVVLIK